MSMNGLKMLNTLPERSLPNIRSILEANSMPVRVPDVWTYNCWGFVAYYLGWEEQAKWLDRYQMEDYLKSNARPINPDEVKAGDIAVFRRCGSHLEHTAIIMPTTSIVCHKPGNNPLCIETVDDAHETYGGTITYVRSTLDNSAECDSV